MKLRTFLVLIMLFLQKIAWCECVTEPQKLLPKWLHELAGNGQKKCSFDAKRISVVSEKDPEIKASRLSTRCADSWVASTKESDHKKYELPAGLRVIRLDHQPESKVLFYINGKAHEGTLPEEAFSGKKDCPVKEETPSIKAFFEEADFALQLSKEMAKRNPKTLPQILKVEEALTQMKERKDLDDQKFQNFSKAWDETLLKHKSDKVARASAIKNMISNSYDPVLSEGKKSSEGTLIVPISQEWFQSNPKLAEFYKTIWIGSGLDPRIAAGATGEGVQNFKGDETRSQQFIAEAALLEKTNQFLQSEPDLKKSPEAEWLKTQSKLGITNNSRMIFISPKTWNNNAADTPWAELIPVDQSLGGIKSDYLMSVMIHEINVNSEGFLPTDTHQFPYESANMQKCVKKFGLKEIENNPATLQAVFGLNPQVSTVTLKVLLDQMDLYLK